jgi:hypothetical protein
MPCCYYSDIALAASIVSAPVGRSVPASGNVSFSHPALIDLEAERPKKGDRCDGGQYVILDSAFGTSISGSIRQ